MHAAKCLATPIFVDHTPYYMLVHHSRSSYILHIIANVMTSYGGKVHPRTLQAYLFHLMHTSHIHQGHAGKG